MEMLTTIESGSHFEVSSVSITLYVVARRCSRILHSSGYTQTTCSFGGGPYEGIEAR